MADPPTLTLPTRGGSPTLPARGDLHLSHAGTGESGLIARARPRAIRDDASAKRLTGRHRGPGSVAAHPSERPGLEPH